MCSSDLHAFDLRAQHHRVPQGVGAGGEAFVAFVIPGDHRLIVGFNFVRRVDQNQTAARDRRQLSFQLLVAIGFIASGVSFIQTASSE